MGVIKINSLYFFIARIYVVFVLVKHNYQQIKTEKP